MYPPGSATTVEVRGPAEGWEGAERPGHFRGVATVCAKLFNQTGADVAVFGEKDWQQLQVVRRMARDLDLPVRVVGADAPAALAGAVRGLERAGFGVDYLALVEAETLRHLDAAPRSGPARLVAAARLGTARLLDNLPVPPEGDSAAVA